MLFFRSDLMVEVVSSTRSARITVLPHPLQPKASLCSLGQSSSSLRRVKCSPHPLHSRTICPEGSIVRSNNFFDVFRVSVIPLLAPHDRIITGGPHKPLGLPPPYDPGGAAIGPTLPQQTTISCRVQREAGVKL